MIRYLGLLPKYPGRGEMKIFRDEVVHYTILSTFIITCLKFSKLFFFFLNQNKQWTFDHQEPCKGFKSVKQEMDWEQNPRGRSAALKTQSISSPVIVAPQFLLVGECS